MPDTGATYLLAITVDSDARLRAGVAACLKCLGRRAGICTSPLCRLPDGVTVAELLEAEKPNRPRRTALVGSSRFKATFHEVAERLEKAGHLVLMMGFFQHADKRPVSDAERAVLERVDRHRLDLADEALVIDCPQPWCPACQMYCMEPWIENLTPCCAAECERRPYVGESTRREIAYAESIGKPVRYLSEEGG